MAKRFIDTDVFKKSFIKGLQGSYKLLWFYIINDCNHAGIWEVDYEIAGLRCGFNFDEKTAKEQFKDKIVIFDGGAKWFIPSFINFQYGELNEKNRVHASILAILKKYNLNENKPLTSPLQGVKDMDKDKDLDKEQDKEGGVGGILGEMQKLFLSKNKDYKFTPDDLSSIREVGCWLGDNKDIMQCDHTKILTDWETMLKNIEGNDHWKTYTLQQVFKFRAAIFSYKPKVLQMNAIIPKNKFEGRGGIQKYE